MWQQEPRAVFKEIQMGKIGVDQTVWESSVAVRLWVLGEGKTVRQETHEQKHGSRSLHGVLNRTQPQVRATTSVTPFSGLQFRQNLPSHQASLSAEGL